MTREELIAALERAEAPGRELDGLIARQIGWAHEKRGKDRREWWYRPDGRRAIDWFYDHPPAFTASIDAALTLVPGAHEALIHTTGAARVWPIEGRRSDDLSYGPTPAIALCIAALKARA